MVVDAELLGDAAGVVDVADRAAARVAVAAPQLHRDPDDLAAGVEQEGGRDRRVDAAAHGDEHGRAGHVVTSAAQRRSLATAVGITSRARSTSAARRRRSEREAQRPGRHLLGHAHGRQHVRRLHRPAGARRGRRRVHAGAVEQEQERLALDAGDADVRRSGDLGRRRHGLDEARDGGLQPGHQAVAQGADALDHRGPLGRGDPQRLGHADDAGDVVRAAAAVALLAAAEEERLERHAVADDERADALRPAELVGTDGDEVSGGGDRGDVEPHGALHRVGVEHRLGRPLGDDRGDRRRRAAPCRPRCWPASPTPAARRRRGRRRGPRGRPGPRRRRRRPVRRGARRGGARRGARRRCTPRRHRDAGWCRGWRGRRPRCRSR